MFNHEYDYRPNWTTRSSVTGVIITLTKFVIYKALFTIKTQEIARFFFASNEKKKSHLSWRVMARTVQLLRHDEFGPIKLSY